LLGLFICLTVIVCNSVSTAAHVTVPGTAVPAAFLLPVSKNGRHLVQADGRPFLVTGDPVWFLIVQLNAEIQPFWRRFCLLTRNAGTSDGNANRSRQQISRLMPDPWGWFWCFGHGNPQTATGLARKVVHYAA